MVGAPDEPSVAPLQYNALAGGLMAAGMLVVVMVLMRKARQLRARRVEMPQMGEARAHIQSLHESAAARESLDNVLADCEETARRLAALVETKAARLEALLVEAEATAERLERAAGAGAGAVGGLPSDAGRRAAEMAARGLDAHGIAAELGRPVGEVELMLALQRGRGSGAA